MARVAFCVLTALCLLAPIPAFAEPAYGPADLVGTWNLHLISAAGANTSPGSTLQGVIEVDGAGTITAGQVRHADGGLTTLTGGNLSVGAEGLVTGVFVAGPAVATIVEARVLRDRQAVVGVIAGGDLSDEEGADFGLFALVRDASGPRTSELAGTWRYHELRTPASRGPPPVWIVGSVVFDAAGTVSGGGLADSAGHAGAPAGALAVTGDGDVAGTLTAITPGARLEGQLDASRDQVVATTSANGSAVGMAILGKVPPAGGFVAADARGPWQLYALSLDGATGNRGTFLRGALAFDPALGVFRARLVDAAGAQSTLTGPLTVDPASGRIAGRLAAAGATLDLDGTLRAARDGATGVLTLRDGAGTHHGLVVLVRTVIGLRLSAASYAAAEGGSAKVVVQRTGEPARAVSAQLVVRFANASVERTLPVLVAAGAVSSTVLVPVPDDGLVNPGGTRTLDLQTGESDVVLEAPSQATLAIVDDEQPGTIAFASDTYSVGEGNKSVTVVVQRKPSVGGKLGGGVTVQYAVDGGSAVAGVDYAPLGGTLSFGAGVGSQSFTVTARDNRVADGPRTIVLRLGNTSAGATVGSPSLTTVTIVDDDQGGVIQFSDATYQVSEHDGTAAITVKRRGGTAGGASVEVEVADDTARAGVDYVPPASGVLAFGAGDDTATLRVAVNDTPQAEGDRGLILRLKNPRGGATLGALREARLTILDDEVGLRFSARAYTVGEQDKEAVITVLRTGPVTDEVTVAVATADGSAVAGKDYTPVSDRVTFKKGEKRKTVKVKIVDDAVVEGPTTVLLLLSDPKGPRAMLGPVAQAVLTIIDNDQPGTIRLAASNFSVRESAPVGLAQAVIVVVREDGAGIVTVDYATSDGTGQAGRHYGQASGQLTFGAGEKIKTILVPVLDDRVADGNHTFKLTLSNVSAGGTLGTPSEALVTILDDDAGGVIQFQKAVYRVTEPSTAATTTVAITVERGGDNLAGGVSVQYATSDGTAVADTARALGDYVPAAGQLVFGPGERVKAFEVTVRGDAVLEPDETVTLTLSDPQGGATLGARAMAVLTIVDASPSFQFGQAEYHADHSSKTVTLTVVRSGPLDDALQVSYATADIPAGEAPGGAVAGVDYKATKGTLTFRPNQSTATFAVTLLDGGAPLGVSRAFRAVLSAALKTSTGEAVPLGAVATALVTIRDDPAPVIQFASPDSSVREGDSVNITVLRSGNLLGTVVVNWAPVGPAGGITPASGSLTFPPGVTSKTFALKATADRMVEGPQTIVLGVSFPSHQTPMPVPGAQASTRINIQDVDLGGTIELGSDTFTVGEGDTATLTVVRNGGQGGGVTVKYATADGTALAPADYEARADTLTFGPGETKKTFQVKTKSNPAPGPDKTFGVVLSDPRPPGLAALGARTSGTVLIADKQSRVSFSAAAYRVKESDRQALIMLTRTPPLAGEVRVRVATSSTPGPGRAVAGVDYKPVNEVVTIRANAPSTTIPVTIFDNAVLDGSRSLTLVLSDPVGASLGLATAELTVDDDEQAGVLAFTQSGYAVVEGRTATLTVARTGGATGVVSVRYEILPASTATAGTDHTLTPGTLMFAEGQTSAVIEVPTVTDRVPEGNETVVVRLADPTNGATLGAQLTATLFIIDAEQTVGFSAGDFTVDETAGSAEIMVVRSGVPSATAIVSFRTEGGTAVVGRDYTPTAATLTFGPGVAIQKVTVPIAGKRTKDIGNRTVGLVLEPATPGLVLSRNRSTLTILAFNPDLIVLSIKPSSSAIRGKALGAPLQIQNIGRAGSPPFTVGVFMAKRDTPGGDLPGAGRLLTVQDFGPLAGGASTGVDLSVDIAADAAPGEYYMSAVANFGQDVGESDRNNNGRTSAPAVFRISRDASKYTVAAAEITQGDVVAPRAGRLVATGGTEGGCDATGQVSLNGNFQIVSQIGTLAQAAATLTGTFNDQPVRYTLSLSFDLGDDDRVTGSFTILSVAGAFSATGSGTLTGALSGAILQGNVSGTLATVTPRSCRFVGTLTASGDPSVTLSLQQRAIGGRFNGGLTPSLPPAKNPVKVDEYLAVFRATFDGDFPPAAAVTFTGPDRSGLAGTPASARRSTLDEATATAEYVSPLVAHDKGGPGGPWSVSYKGAPRLFTLPDPNTPARLVLPIPDVTVNASGALTTVRWTWRDASGAPIAVPAYVDRVAVSLEPGPGRPPLYESARMLRGNTSHTLTAPVLWEDVAELAMLYVDSVTGDEYRVAYPRDVHASVDLAFERTTDKTGIHEAQNLTVTLQAPSGQVSTATPDAVVVRGGPFAGDIVPFVGQTLMDGAAFDVFRLQRDVSGSAPAPGTRLTVRIVPLTGGSRDLVVSVLHRATLEAIDITSPTGTREADSTLGKPLAVTWTLPRPAASGGFDVAEVSVSALVRVDDGAHVCAVSTDEELGPEATTTLVTFPATCMVPGAGARPVESAQVCVTVLGEAGERTDACHGFGPDDDVVQLDATDYTVTEGRAASIVVMRQGPRRHETTVAFAATATGAAAPADVLDPVSRLVTFKRGEDRVAFPVTARDDRLVQPDRAFVLRLANASAGTVLGPPSQATLTVKEGDDGGDIQFAADSIGVTEGTASVLKVTRRGTNLAGNVSIDYAVVPGVSVTTGYTLSGSGRLTFGPDDTELPITVTTVDDDIAQRDRSFVLRLSNPRGGGRLGKPTDTRVTIVDDEQGGRIQFEQAARTVVENTGLVLLSVNRSKIGALRLGANVSVNYRVIGGTARAGIDYTLPPGPLVFGVEETGRTIPLRLIDNAIGDGNRTLTLELFDAQGGGATLGTPARLDVTIADDEQTIEFQDTQYSVAENNKSVTLLVRRTGNDSALNTQATVRFAAVPGTAGANDFAGGSGTLTFNPKDTLLPITILIKDDSAAQGDRTFFVDLSSPSPPGVVLGARTRATVTILDDEQLVQFAGDTIVPEGTAAVLSVTRRGGLNTSTKVSWMIQPGGTAVAGVDYDPPSVTTLTIPPGKTSQPITFTTRPNTRLDGNRSFAVRLLTATVGNSSVAIGPPSLATATITDVNAGGAIAFDQAAKTVSEKSSQGVQLGVVRTGQRLGGPVFVDYTVSATSTAQPGVDYQPIVSGTLTFLDDSTTPRSPIPAIVPIDNNLAVGDRTVVINLGNPRGGGASLGPASQATVTIEDDDGSIRFSAGAYSGTEGKPATITVARAGAVGKSDRVRYRVGVEGGAPDGVASGDLIFDTGVLTQTFTVTIRPDSVAQGPRRFSLTLVSPATGTVLSQATLTIADDDDGGTIQFAAAAAHVSEGNAANITVTRTAGPGLNLASDVAADYSVVGGTAVAGVDYDPTTASGTLTFGERQTSVTITVKTLPDTVLDGPRTLVLRLGNARGGARLGTTTDTTLTIDDTNQGGVVQFGQALFTIDESAGTASLTVTRTGTKLADGATVDVRVAAGGTAPSTDYSLLTPTLTFAANQTSATVKVKVNDNDVVDGSRTVLLDLVNPRGGATLGAVTRATLTILDDAQVLQFQTSSYLVAEGDSVTLQLMRSGPLGAAATVSYQTVSNTAQAGVDFKAKSGSVTFPPNVSTVPITVATIQNQTFAATALSFFVDLQSPSVGAALGPRVRATVTIKDDEQKVQFADPSYTVTEGDTVKLTVVRLGTPDGTVSVRYATQPGTAGSKDFVSDSGVVTFASGVTSRTITIKTRSDTVTEGPETFSVVLSEPEAPLLLGAPSTAQVTILPN